MRYTDKIVEQLELRLAEAEVELVGWKNKCQDISVKLVEMQADLANARTRIKCFEDAGGVGMAVGIFTVRAERDRLREALNTIATNYDCDPRAEARDALRKPTP